MNGAGALNRRVTFARRVETDDGYGNRQSTFADQCTVWARIKPLKGGENVMADRLSGTQPVIISVRASAQTRLIAADWQARDAQGAVYAVTAPPANMDERDAMLDILATIGPAS